MGRWKMVERKGPADVGGGEKPVVNVVSFNQDNKREQKVNGKDLLPWVNRKVRKAIPEHCDVRIVVQPGPNSI